MSTTTEKLWVDGTLLNMYFNVGVSGPEVYNAPARKGEAVSVPGRNGDIWVDGGAYENIVVRYPCWIADEFRGMIDKLRAFLASKGDAYYKISDSYHSGEYRMGRWLGPLNVETGTGNKTAKFDLLFECHPQRYLSGAIADPVTSSARENPSEPMWPYIDGILGDGSAYVQRLGIENVTLFDAYPTISFDPTSGPSFVFWVDTTYADRARLQTLRRITFEPYTGPMYMGKISFDFQTMQAYYVADTSTVEKRLINVDFDVETFDDLGATEFYIQHGEMSFIPSTGETSVRSKTTYIDSTVTSSFKVLPNWYTL